MTNRRVIVIGSSSGIGLEVVKLFAAQPSNHVWALSRFTSGKTVFDDYDNVTTCKLDLDSERMTENLQQLLSAIDEVDILINCAGYLVNKPFSSLTKEEISTSFGTNIIGIMLATQQIIEKASPKGLHVVNISSMGGFQGSVKFPGLTAYASSKAALANFTEVFAEEYKTSNIVMNCLCLGAVQTKMLESAFPGHQAHTQPIEMAEFIVDFALNGNKFFNGKIIPVSNTTP